ncbi:DUF397 domain-containing protein [Streptomyces sp. NPDC003077]|uniref:DUF397 domain-containing protein n=1 Tax=Streptomyces sp. NPDC003077 TaxID=3154443 RepID=UPI0033ABFFD2
MRNPREFRLPDDQLAWRRSSYSGAQGDCVEIAELAGAHYAVRDSKNPRRARLVFPAEEWAGFIGVLSGDGFPA